MNSARLTLITSSAIVLANTYVCLRMFSEQMSIFDIGIVYWLEVAVIFLFSGMKLMLLPFQELTLDDLRELYLPVKESGFFSKIIFFFITLPLLCILAFLNSFAAVLPFVFFIAKSCGVILLLAGTVVIGLSDGGDLMLFKKSLEKGWSIMPALATCHAISFALHYLYGKEFKDAKYLSLMIEPYKRVAYLFIVFIVAALFKQLNSEMAVAHIYVGLLVSIKVILDVRSHRQMHLRTI